MNDLRRKIAVVGTGYVGLSNAILAKKPQKVGIYRLVMKAGSDNYRASAIQPPKINKNEQTIVLTK